MTYRSFIRRCMRLFNAAVAFLLIGAVRLYQMTFGLILGGHCRFTPTCSVYYIEAVRKYGPWRGSLKGFWRLLRCHPWQPGGFDPP